MKKLFIGLVVAGLIMSGCFGKKPAKVVTDNSQNINSQQENVNQNIENTKNGQDTSSQKEVYVDSPSRPALLVEDIVVGIGAQAKAGDQVEIFYTMKSDSGVAFDTNIGNALAFSFKLGQGKVMAGMDQGIAGMSVGGKRKVTIPPHLAFGAQGYGDVVQPNTTVILEVELIKVN